jgi:hypothetical protein
MDTGTWQELYEFRYPAAVPLNSKRFHASPGQQQEALPDIPAIMLSNTVHLVKDCIAQTTQPVSVGW